MPEITYDGETIECADGANLRSVLLDNGLSPHTGITKRINCGGNATCGTCAVRITEGPVRADEQATRLSIATHDDKEEVRLACQYAVTEDIVIEQP